LLKWNIIILCLCLSAPLSYAADESPSATSVIVVIEGLSGDELLNVEAALKLPEGLIKDGKVDRIWLTRFERQAPDKVKEALQVFGYYQPDISVALEATEKVRYKLHIQVRKGDPVIINKVSISIEGAGSSEAALTELINRVPLHQGDILRQDKYEELEERIKNKAVALGYLDADFSVHTIKVTLEALSAEINLVLQTGRPYYFGDISFEGLPLYPVSFLQRYLDFKTGDRFSYEKIAKTQFNLIGADRFKEVTVNPLKDQTKDGHVPIEIRLFPSPQKRFKFGLGYGSDTGLRGTVAYNDLNLAGSGHEFNTEIKLSEKLQGLAARYVLPDQTDFKSFNSLNLGLQRENLTDQTTNVVSLEGEHTRSLGFEQLGSFYVRLQKENSTAGDQTTNSFIVLPGVRYLSRQYDNQIRPTKGYYYDLELRGTSEVLGSATGFAQFLTNGAITVSLPGRFSFLARARLGTTFLCESTEDLPISLRFFAGGDLSVRGYAYKSLGPVDSHGDVVGGKHMVVGNFELERAIGSNWGAAIFYDAGNAFNDFNDMKLAQGGGLGIRYYTPIGSLNLDIARQIGVSNPDFRIHFTIGIRL
jgi:translocation and assembly module TamA